MTDARDGIEVDALVADRYLDGLLAAGGRAEPGQLAFGWADGPFDRAIRLASLRLRRDLPRFHPSFRFEERLAVRLAEAASTLGLAQAVGSEGVLVPLAGRSAELRELAALVEPDEPFDLRRRARPLLIGGAVASAAISLAGAAIVAWRRGHPPGPMARAVRAVRAARVPSPRRVD